MRQRELANTMGVDELLQWLAYDLSGDEDFKNRMKIEEQKNYTAEQEAAAIKNFFMGIQCQ